MGDIRIGGYNFGNSTLAVAYLPPPADNYSIAGDIAFNTGQAFHVGSNYDVFSVAMHEIGHALGLLHSTTSAAVMSPTYSKVQTALNNDDITGIRKIYSNGNPRSADAYDARAANGSFGAASDLTATINTTTKTALVQNLDLTTTSDVDYYKFTAPSGGTGSLTVTVRSAGLSLLSPKFYVYNSSQAQIAMAGTSGTYGATYSTTVSGIVAGKVYSIKVVGAETVSAKLPFNTGQYALTLNLGSGANPTVPLPSTQTANGATLTSTGGIAQNIAATGNADGNEGGPGDTFGTSADSPVAFPLLSVEFVRILVGGMPGLSVASGAGTALLSTALPESSLAFFGALVPLPSFLVTPPGGGDSEETEQPDPTLPAPAAEPPPNPADSAGGVS
jgi:hypothetical protein